MSLRMLSGVLRKHDLRCVQVNEGPVRSPYVASWLSEADTKSRASLGEVGSRKLRPPSGSSHYRGLDPGALACK